MSKDARLRVKRAKGGDDDVSIGKPSLPTLIYGDGIQGRRRRLRLPPHLCQWVLSRRVLFAFSIRPSTPPIAEAQTQSKGSKREGDGQRDGKSFAAG